MIIQVRDCTYSLLICFKTPWPAHALRNLMAIYFVTEVIAIALFYGAFHISVAKCDHDEPDGRNFLDIWP